MPASSPVLGLRAKISLASLLFVRRSEGCPCFQKSNTTDWSAPSTRRPSLRTSGARSSTRSRTHSPFAAARSIRRSPCRSGRSRSGIPMPIPSSSPNFPRNTRPTPPAGKAPWICWSIISRRPRHHRPSRRQVGNGSFSIVSASWDKNWVAAYNQHFATINPWLKNLKKRPVGLAVPAEFMCDRATLAKAEFYNDFMKPQDLLSGVGVTINQDRDRFIAVSVDFPKRSAEREQDNLALLQQLTPHFRKAMQINRQLARAKLDRTAVETGLDQLSVGLSACGSGSKEHLPQSRRGSSSACR